jgi:toxin CptA
VSEHIRVAVRASRLFWLLLLFAHVLASAGLFLAATQPWVLLCGYVALGMSGAWCIRRAVRSARVHTVVGLAADRSCTITGMQDPFSGLLRADSIALPWLVVLRIDCGGGRGTRSIVLFPDSASADDWRHLRVFLRWGVRFAGAAPAPSGGPN